ncbi:uncharacterized protein KD926_010642 [Aspergillus affinis]|uniref:uncharacterized protein n=1 Tax=Aspergillus affinis TaxID=1070780 RepID=UPI0022FE0324|nr:uncharacterized protein KD926_010642 [Aspergillus affinis]KAI9038597.1 hypothetical protein KD926_010642 [Aspergillus affinis]
MVSNMEKKITADSRPSADLPQDPYQETIPSKETTNDTDTNFHSLSPPMNSPLDIEQKDEEADRPPISEAEQKEPVVVPRLKRRGLFGQLTLLAEIENPKTYARKTKWFITFIVAVAGATAPMGSSIFFLSSSIAMLIVMRMLSGGASASVQAVGAGTIADLWDTHERGRAMSIFYLGPLCGPLLAPIIGGALAQRWGWRSTLWFLAVYGAITVIFIFLALPETLVTSKAPSMDEEQQEAVGRQLSRVSSRQVVQFTTKWLRILKMVFIDPLKIVLYLRYPPVFLTVYYASITFGSLYVLNVSIEHTFGRSPYNFATIIVGLLYLPNSVGYMVASSFGGRWMDEIMQREARKAERYDENGKLIYHPEDRMRENAWLGALLYPAALIWYGWTADRGVFWLAPMIANFFFGIGSMLIFSMATTMLTEFMPKKSSAGVALNNFMRNIFSCVGSLVTAPIIDAIGNGWLFTILGLVAFASSSVLFAMKIFGPRWRKSMDALSH